MMTSRIVSAAAAGIALASLAVAGEKPAERKVERVLLRAGAPGMMAFHAGPQGAGDVVFLMAHEGMEGRVVKNAPYSADAVSEHVQTMSDGNRIVRRTSGLVARDSEGRTRREHVPTSVMLPVGGEAPRLAFIHDPVTGTRWVLDFEMKVARRMAMPHVVRHTKEAGTPGDARHVEVEEDVVFERALPPPAEGARVRVERIVRTPGHEISEAPAKTEELGARAMEGVEAEGTRSVTVIPAGEIGNENPIEIVSERWYSKQLQAVVMTRHVDPRFGETTWKLTNIVASEPDRALFEVPSDLKVEAMERPDMIRIRRDREK
jgi:hypothetical protein